MRRKLDQKSGFLTVLALAALTACGGGGVGGPVSDVTGTWQGGLYQTGVNFRLQSMGFEIVESDGTITGTGSVQGSGIFTVEGTRSGSSATIRFHLPTESNFIVLEGTFTNTTFRSAYTQRGTTTPMTKVRLERK